jgi:general secretion pathway protein G
MKRRAGFTLIELVVTVGIVALLASAAMPFAELTIRRGKEQQLTAALREIRTAIDAYKDAFDRGRIEQIVGATGYPPTLDVLYEGVEDASSPDRKMMFFIRRIPRDPLSPDGSVAPAQTWGLRSYASSPEDPRAGDDVYDVYSLSQGTALNGSRYRDW